MAKSEPLPNDCQHAGRPPIPNVAPQNVAEPVCYDEKSPVLARPTVDNPSLSEHKPANAFGAAERA